MPKTVVLSHLLQQINRRYGWLCHTCCLVENRKQIAKMAQEQQLLHRLSLEHLLTLDVGVGKAARNGKIREAMELVGYN